MYGCQIEIGLYQVVDEIENYKVSFRRVSCNEECVYVPEKIIGVNHFSVCELRKGIEFFALQHSQRAWFLALAYFS